MKRCQVLAPLNIDGKRFRRGDVLTGAEAQAVADSPIHQARCTQVQDVPDDHGASALPGAAVAPAPKGDSK